jgi:drug/metabolite transporter (DMT)-like permease
MTTQNPSLFTYLEVHWIVFIWGFTAILGRLIEVTALDLVWNRMVLALTLMWLWARWRQVPLKLPASSLLPLLATGGIIALHWVTFYHAIRISNISLTLAGLATSALWAALIKALMQRKKPGVREWILSLMAVAAMTLLVQVRTFPLYALGTAVLSAVLAAWFAVLNAGFTKQHPPLLVACWEMLGGIAFLSLWLILQWSLGSGLAGEATHPSFPWPWLQPKPMDWFWLLVLAAVCTAYPFVASIRLMRQIDPFSFVLSVNMEPVYGIALGWLLFGQSELMSLPFYLGTALLLGSVVADALVQRVQNRRALRLK